jgi:hypothetical protein
MPDSVAVADFNGDGIPDMAVANYNYEGSGSVTVLLGNGDGTFRSAPDLLTGIWSESPVVADFNCDGVADLAIVNDLNGSLSIFLSNGDGKFRTGASPSTGKYPTSAAVGDFNGDGKPDLAVANYGANTLTILLGNGDGTFTPAKLSPATGSEPGTVAVSDFNGDGKADLVVWNSGDSTLTLLLGKGDGTFTPAGKNAIPLTWIRSVIVGDFNGDGIQDLAVSDNDDNLPGIVVLLGNGDGTFKAAPKLSMSDDSLTASFAVGDFNGDGIADLAWVRQFYNSVTLLIGNGDGTFRLGPSAPVGSFPPSVSAADLDGDGVPDLAVPGFGGLNSPGDSVSVLLTVPQTAVSIASGIAPAGLGPHLVLAKYPGDSKYGSSISAPAVLFEEPRPTTTSLTLMSGGKAVTTTPSGTAVTLTATVKIGNTPVTAGSLNFCDAAAKYCEDIHLIGSAQLTNAGNAELKFVPGFGGHSYKAVFVGAGGGKPSTSNAVGLTVTGKLQTATTLAKSGSAGSYTLTATVSGQGTEPPTGTVSFLNTTNGNLILGKAQLGTATSGLAWAVSQTPGTDTNPDSIATGDFNGDGVPDLAVANCTASFSFTQEGSLTILLGNGDGTFSPGVNSPLTVGRCPNAVVAGDFNGDGKTDLAVLNLQDQYVTILLGSGNGTFKKVAQSPITGWALPQAMAVGDFNGDGNLDLVVTNTVIECWSCSGWVTVLLGNGDGTFTPTQTNSPTAVNPHSIVVADFNGDGKMDLAVANEYPLSGGGGSSILTILLGNGDGTFTAAPSPAAGCRPWSVAAADFNGDGIPDLAFGSACGGTISLLLGVGDGTFSPSVTLEINGIGGVVVVGDFNGDGNADLAATNFLFYDGNPYGGTNTMSILLGNGDGTFANATTQALGSQPNSAVIGDFNGDGRSDVAVTNSADKAVEVLLAENIMGEATVTGIAPVGTGTQLIKASYSGDNSYSPSLSGAIGLTPTHKPQTITFPQPASPVTYGVKLIALSAAASSKLAVSFGVLSGPGKVNGTALAITGAGTVVVAANQAGNATYDAAQEVKRDITVSKASLKVAANDLSMKQGGTVPVLTYTMTGFVNGDTQAKATTGKPVLSTTATSKSAPGSYPITVSVAKLAAANYSFNPVQGTLTVTK